MSDEHFSELVAGFVRIIKETLATSPVTSYATSALIVGRRGDIEFEVMVEPDDANSGAANDAAYQLGKQLASRHSDIVAVLVAEQIGPPRHDAAILISIGAPQGYRNSLTLSLTRTQDGTLRVTETPDAQAASPIVEPSITPGGMVMQGFMDMAKREAKGE